MPREDFIPKGEFLTKGDFMPVGEPAGRDLQPESANPLLRGTRTGDVPEEGPPRKRTDGSEGNYGPGGYGHGYGYGGGDYGAGGEEEGGKMMIAGRTLQDYGIWYLRFSWLIALFTIIAGFGGYYVFTITPKSYESWARIEIERLAPDAPEVYQGERVRVQEKEEFRAAVERLRLPRIYSAVAAKPAILSRAGSLPQPIAGQHSGADEAPEAGKGAISQAELTKLLMKWVRVEWSGQSNYVDVRVTHRDPQFAKDILDGIIAEYEALSAESSFSGSEQYALDYILEKSSQIREKILKGEGAVSRYRGCEELSGDIREVQGEIAALEKRYLADWPDLIEAKQRYSSLVDRFASELELVIGNSAEEKVFWTEKEAEWRGKEGTALLEAQLQLVAMRGSLLNKELQTDERILDGLVAKSKEADVSRGYSAKQFAVVQPPTMPVDPVAPQLKRVLTIFMGGGFSFAFMLVFVLGLVDQSIRTVSEMESITGLPVVGAVPSVEVRKKGAPIDLLLESKSDASGVEALRTLRAGLAYLGDQEGHSSYVISSALPSEGKSWIAANLAVAFAQQGDKTLLIDGDLRRPVISASFGLSRETAGLTDYLARSVPLESIVHPSATRNLWIVPAGGKAPNPAELLGSRNLKAFLRDISVHFERVVIDSAPLLPVSDTLLIARHVQSVLVVYRAGRTPRGALLRALKNLRSNRTEAAGLVANLLPRLKRGSGYAYGYYYSYYGGSNSKYYEESDA